MRELQFNFNNEVGTITVQQEDDGRIIIPGADGPMAEYASMQQFAEQFALARDVKPENLKNWQLLENGDVVSFVLRVGTAGVSVDDIQEQLDEVLTALAGEGNFHPLDVARVRQEISTGGNVMDVLAMSAVPDVAREVYDRLDAMGAFAEPEQEVEEVDERDDIQRYLDNVMEKDGSVAFFAQVMNLNTDADKTAVYEAIVNSPIPYTADMLDAVYENALRTATVEGINVDNRFDAILVTSQAVPGVPSNEAKKKVITAATLAGRDKVNVSSYVVGHNHIRKTAVLMTRAELENAEVYMQGSIPVVVVFDAGVDEELEEERRQEEEAAEETGFEDTFDEEEDYENEESLDDEFDDEWDN